MKLTLSLSLRHLKKRKKNLLDNISCYFCTFGFGFKYPDMVLINVMVLLNRGGTGLHTLSKFLGLKKQNDAGSKQDSGKSD